MEIGLIGLGATGTAVAEHLLGKTSKNLLVYDPDGRTCADAEHLPTAAELVSRCEVVFLSLEREGELLCLLSGVAPFLRQGQTLIDLTDISPALAHQNANTLRRQGVAYLDCGIFSDNIQLKQPFLFFVGGSSEVFARVRGILRCVAPECRYMGPSGRGQAARVLCRALAGDLDASLQKTLGLAQALGMQEIDFAGFMQIARPFALLEGNQPTFSLQQLEKDRALAREMARRAGIQE